MRFILTIICSAITCLLTCQTFNIRFDAAEDLLGEIAFSIEHSPEGFLVVTGTESMETAPCVAFQIIDPEGNLLSSSMICDSLDTHFAGWSNSSHELSQGGYIVGGTIGTLDSASILLTNLQADGTVNWIKQLQNENSEFEVGQAAKQCEDGGFVIAAFYIVDEDSDGLLIKTDMEGNEIWRTSWGFPDSNDRFTQVVELPGLGFACGGWSQSLGSSKIDMCVIGFDMNGEEEWSYAYENEVDDVAAHVSATSSGEVIFCGQRITVQNGDTGFPVLGKLDSEGEELWTAEYGPDWSQHIFLSAKEDGEGNIICAGETVIPNVSQGGLLCKVSSEGDSLWYRNYYNIYNDHCWFYDVIINDDGGYTACGMSQGNLDLGLSFDSWVIRTDEYGCIIPGCHVGIEEFEKSVGVFSLGPNPAMNGKPLNMFFKSASSIEMELQIINSLGNEVFRRDNVLNNSTYTFPSLDLPQGTYVVNVWDDGNLLDSKPLIVQ